MMDIKQLTYFLTIAEEGQITSAARKLHMAQPPLSHQLRLLEEELGVRLVERGSRSIRLTDAGETLKMRAEQILTLAKITKKEVRDRETRLRGTLSIGTISSSGAVIPSRRMLEFRDYFPDICIDIHEGNTFAVLDMLEKGIVEVGVVRTPFPDQHLNCRFAAPEPMAAVMTAANDPFPGSNELTVGQLEGQPLIIYRRFEKLIRSTFEKQGIEPFICCCNDDARTTVIWAKSGFGIGIVPQSAVSIMGGQGLVTKKIECPDLITQLAAIWVKGRYLSAFGEKFIDAFVRNFGPQIGQNHQ